MSRENFDVEFPIAPESESPLKIDTPLKKVEKKFEKNSFNLEIEEQISPQFHQGSSSRGQREIILWSFAALSIDLLLTFAFSCLALISALLWGKFEWIDLTSFVNQNFSTFFIGTAIGSLSIYMLMLRIYLGFTIGDWACGLRLGSLKQRLSSHYSILVLARTALILMTGVVTLPLLSLILGNDIAGKITGLALVSKR